MTIPTLLSEGEVGKVVMAGLRSRRRVRVVLLDEAISSEPVLVAGTELTGRSVVPSLFGNELQEIDLVLVSPFNGGDDSNQGSGGKGVHMFIIIIIRHY